LLPELAPDTHHDPELPTGEYQSVPTPVNGNEVEPPPGLQAAAPLPAISGYEILGVLGRGGMGVVYQARQTKLKRLVALKMILAGAHAGPPELERFRLEAEVVARLQHPNIVQIHEVGEHDGKPYFSLEFIEGGHLARKLAGTPLPPREAAQLVAVLAHAMHAAHERGIVHRDLKPVNVLLTRDGVPKITDFGLAKLDPHLGPPGEGGEEGSSRTQTGQIMGTPSYMAPEQAAGRIRDIDPRTDVYALGAILYETLTGRPPFRAASSLETLRQVLEEEPVPPRQLQPQVPRDLETICLKCLRKDPRQRYASAAALAEDLRRFLHDEPIQARPMGAWERGWKWARRRPAVAALLVVSAIAALALVGLAVGWSYSDRLEMALTNEKEQRGQAEQAWREATTQRDQAERARREADQLRIVAETNETEAKKQETKAKSNEGEAVKQKILVRQLLYDADMNLAQQAWHEGDLVRMQELLEKYQPRPDSPEERCGFEWYYLRQLYHQRVLAILKGHQQAVHSVAFAADGRLASSDYGGTVRVWDVDTGQATLIRTKQKGTVFSVAFTADGRRLASGDFDGTVRVWDVHTGQATRTLNGHEGTVFCVAFAADGRLLASGGSDGTVRVWNVDTGQATLNLKEHTSFVRSVAFAADGRRLASGEYGGT
jgi:hypothetical protein